MQNHLIQKGAGLAVIEQALAKALPQLAMAQSIATQCNLDFTTQLDVIVAALSEMHNRVAKTRQHAKQRNSAEG